MSTAAEQQQQETALIPNGNRALETTKRAGDSAIEMSFNNGESFALLQRVAAMFAASSLVPKQYQGNVPNCIIALNMAQRIGADPLMVMQNLYIVHERPGWSAQFLIATFNQCGRFTSLRYEWQGERGQANWGCRAWAVEHLTGEKLYGPLITWEMVLAEGWSTKNGSKWKTIPELMFHYRAAAWFVRAYAPEIAMGLQTVEELKDIPAYEIAPGAFETKLETSGEPIDRAASLTERLRNERDQTSEANQPQPTEAALQPQTDPATGDRGALADAFNDLVEKTTLKIARETLEIAVGVRSIEKVQDDQVAQAIEALTNRAGQEI